MVTVTMVLVMKAVQIFHYGDHCISMRHNYKVQCGIQFSQSNSFLAGD